MKSRNPQKVSGADAADETASKPVDEKPSHRHRGTRRKEAKRAESPASAVRPAQASQSRLTSAATGEKRPPAPFPIVGIGASAGGLEAFTELLKHLRLDTGMGFVLVQHLDPQHESALAQLLTRATSMPVSEVTKNLRVEPNHIYVIRPNSSLTIEQGVLQLQPRQAVRAPHHSVDFFFESLARDRRECGIGVILSGTATDGTVGMEAIKAEGGITFAQDDSARYDSMPRSAIAAGCVDFVLSPENIANELARIAKHPYVVGQPPEPTAPSEGEKESTAENGLKKILLLLRNHSGVDFSLYKSNTVQRRIGRRMLLNKINTPKTYANFLRGKVKELDALYADMLISVTTFFRNPAAFDVLKENVFPKLVERPRDQPLRVWVLGCSAGQEAYSIALSFVEFAEQTGQARKLQLFATDVNQALLDKARAGFYAESLMHDLSPERLRRFFVKEEGGYRASKSLRQMVVFARQNLLSDPPFSRMDLISCRNVLIYLGADAQRKVLPTLHYALKPEGFLFLGESDALGSVADLFELVDKKCKIFSKKPGLTAQVYFTPRHPGQSKEIPAPKAPIAPEGFHTKVNAQREADRITLNRYAPPGVLLNAQWHLLQCRGEIGPFLKPPASNPSFHVLKMARAGLMVPLRAALKKAKEENKPVRREGVQVAQNGGARPVNFDVVPLRHLKERCYLVFFEEAAKVGHAVASAPSREPSSGAGGTLRFTSKKEESRRVAELERELSETRDYLQSVQEQYEAANEESQSSNEEVTSANEELQSINEELETSKEELESVNEELSTVNDEMVNRNAELNRSNADLNNLHASVNMAFLVLTRDLTIRRFTPTAAKLFNLVDTDAGRPLSNLRHNLDLPDLEALLKEVIDTISEREREVRDKAGRCYSLRARPYLTLDNKVDGAVVVLVDIDALKRTEQAIAAARDYAANTIETVREPLIVLDSQLHVESANHSFYHTFHVSPEATVGKFVYDLGNRQWNIPRLRVLLEEILPRQKTIENFEVEQDFEQIGRRTMLLNARRIEDPTWKTHRILLAIEDITERKHLQQQLQSARLAELVLATARDPLLILNADLRVHTANEAFYKTFRVSPAESEGRLISELGNGQWRMPRLRQLLEDVLPRNSFFDHFEVTHDFEHIGQRTMLLNGRKLAGDGAPERILLGIQDITEVLQSQAAAREAYEELRRTQQAVMQQERLRALGQMASGLAHDISNAITPAALYTESLLAHEPGLSKSGRDYLKTIDHAINDVAATVARMREFYRQREPELMLVPVQLNRLVEQVADLTRARWSDMPQQRGVVIELVQELTPELPFINGAESEIREALTNLIFNAVDAMPEGGTLTMRTKVAGSSRGPGESSASERVQVEVSDTGVGMEEDTLKRCMEPFFTTKRERGTGLGLAMVYGMVRRHGAEIELASVLGQGTTVRLSFPGVAANVLEAGQAEPPLATTTGLRILAVDDDPVLLKSLQDTLQAEGHVVVTANSGQAGIDAFRAASGTDEPFTVVITDLGMPSIDGRKVASAVKEASPSTPVVVLTGWGQRLVTEGQTPASVDCVLNKPPKLRELREAFARFCKRADS